MAPPMTHAACLMLAAVLLATLLALPGSGTLVVLTAVLVWTLPPALDTVTVVIDIPVGRTQLLALRAASGPRAPPAARTSTI